MLRKMGRGGPTQLGGYLGRTRGKRGAWSFPMQTDHGASSWCCIGNWDSAFDPRSRQPWRGKQDQDHSASWGRQKTATYDHQVHHSLARSAPRNASRVFMTARYTARFLPLRHEARLLPHRRAGRHLLVPRVHMRGLRQVPRPRRAHAPRLANQHTPT